MKRSIPTLLLLIACLAPAISARADENLAFYGLKGYLFSFSPLVVDGGHAQAGIMFSPYKDNSLNCREGHIWAAPISFVMGDGDWWEAGIATHWEFYENTDAYFDGQDVDTSRSAMGDIFIGGKIRLLGQDQDQFPDQDRGQGIDLSLMPYVLLPTGERDRGIADLYRFVQTDEDHPAWGLNLLLGRRFDQLVLNLNIGLNYMETDDPDKDEMVRFVALAAEYQVKETLTAYLEFVDIENKDEFNCADCSPCYDPDAGDDIREIGVGMDWLKNFWGFKLHLGIGLTDTSPDWRVVALVNRNLFR
ncbi:MAG: hypothetical protein CR990_00330 [Desulfococcus sp.]|nr:MAG: hypothetical protein CR990_00330 [Desulfococcus sp.]